MIWIRLLAFLPLVASLCGCWQTQAIKDDPYGDHTDKFHVPEYNVSEHTTRPVIIYSQWHYESLSECDVDAKALQAFELEDKIGLWARIQAGFALSDHANKRIYQQLSWLKRHPTYIKQVGKRGEPFLHFIVEEIERRGMPSEFALLPMVESAFDPFAYSRSHAAGIWQITPRTGEHLGLKQNWWYDGRRDVIASTHAALDYLEDLHKRFNGDWILALAAYNSGAANVNRAIRRNQKKGLPTHYWALPLPRETEAYVPKLLALKELVNRPDIYNVTLHPINNLPYFRSINIESQIDLAFAADLAGMKVEDMNHLNPGFNRWATAPEGPHRILVPVQNANAFDENLKNVAKEDKIVWERYTVRPGDTLSAIAIGKKTTVTQIKITNKLSSHMIRSGQTLLIPRSSQRVLAYSQTKDQKQKNHRTPPSAATFQYVVKPGDSFWELARRYDTSIQKLAKWNDMTTKDTLLAGQIIALSSPSAKNNNTPRKISYRVKNGDSLYRIANKFNVSLKDVLSWNKVNPSHYLQPGQKLTLYLGTAITNH